jgi:DNA (cytosine-5)-methyltransferase 1
MQIASLFSGAGGLDAGFSQTGFETVYANDIDRDVWNTYERNSGLRIDRRSLFDVESEDLPDADGIIGGPPCQSWSLAGAMRGINDERGQLFYEYIRIIRDKQPKFFVAENVPGMLSRTHKNEFEKIIREMAKLGYRVAYSVFDARNYGVPQERKRVIIVGYRRDLGISFSPPPPSHSKSASSSLSGAALQRWTTIREAISDLPPAVPALDKNKPNPNVNFPNHEYMIGAFSTIYMSRNRRREWSDQSFTIQAGGRHAPLHPESCPMQKVGADKWVFTGTYYRRMTVREAARIQTFPDDFIFYYTNLSQGYKMIGNAVPVKLARAVANKIVKDLSHEPGELNERESGRHTIDV